MTTSAGKPLIRRATGIRHLRPAIPAGGEPVAVRGVEDVGEPTLRPHVRPTH